MCELRRRHCNRFHIKTSSHCLLSFTFVCGWFLCLLIMILFLLFWNYIQTIQWRLFLYVCILCGLLPCDSRLMNEWMNGYIFIILNYVHVTLYIYEHISMFTHLYSPRYNQRIKAYNSFLNKTVHLFKVKDHLYCNIDISMFYIKKFPKVIWQWI